VVLVPFVTVGAGWASGRPEVNPTDGRGKSLQVRAAAARVGLLTVGAELSLRVLPRLLLGLQVRDEIVTQGTTVVDLSCPFPDMTCRPATNALAALAKAATPFVLSPRTRLLASASIGYGRLRHVVRLPTLTDCGPAHDETCIDTLASGPLLLGTGLGLMYDLGGPFAAQTSFGALVGVPGESISVELGAGLAVMY
jgi:hypothetical protein